MATKRRMLSLQIVDTDAFLDMSLSTQALYFHLVMRADDEGFVSNPKKIMRLIGSQEDELKVLIAKRFILSFDSGIVVIKHWLIHNKIRMDRFNETVYQDEKNKLILKKNKAYTEKWQPNGNQMATKWQPNGNQMATQVNISKDKLSKYKLRESRQQVATPSQIADSFLNDINSKYREKFLNKFSSNEEKAEKVKQEMLNFISYWTEPNKSGTKQRWQTEKTFEVGRRLSTWFNRSKDFNNNKSRFLDITNI